VWLKRALSNIKEANVSVAKAMLAPRFYADVLFENGKEVEVQWKKYASREISYNENRVKSLGLADSGLDYYKSLMAQAFITMNAVLKDDGILVTYFAHTLPEAWAELIEAGWKYGGFTVTNGFPLATESTRSIVKRGKLSLDTSIVVVWRKSKEKRPVTSMDAVKEEMLKEGIEWTRKVLGKYYGRDLFFSVFTRVLSVATRYSSLYDSRGELDAKRLVEKYVTPLTAKALVLAVGREETGEVTLDRIALFYFVTKLLYSISGAEIKAKTLAANDVVLLSIATGVDKKEIIESTILVKSKEGDEYKFMEPLTNNKDEFEEFLKARGIDIDKLAVVDRKPTSVDVLYMLEYVTWFTKDPQYHIERIRKMYPTLFENALTLARLLVRSLPNDPESKLCGSIFLYVGAK